VRSLNISNLCSVLAELEGGTVVDSIEDCTHAVLRHVKQDEYQRAVELGTISVVRPEWVIHCAAKQHLHDEVGILQVDLITASAHSMPCLRVQDECAGLPPGGLTTCSMNKYKHRHASYCCSSGCTFHHKPADPIPYRLMLWPHPT
jgi:hypothetical protein